MGKKHIDTHKACKHTKMVFEADDINEIKANEPYCWCFSCGFKWTKKEWLEHQKNK